MLLSPELATNTVTSFVCFFCGQDILESGEKGEKLAWHVLKNGNKQTRVPVHKKCLYTPKNEEGYFGKCFFCGKGACTVVSNS